MIKSTEPIHETFRGEDVVVRGVEYHVCESCGETEFSMEALDSWSKKIDEAFREKLGLLSPGEIRAIRKEYNLTQDEFQRVIGVGKTTVCRWETGKIVQPKAEDNLMRAMINHPCVASEMMDRAEVCRSKTRAATVCETFKIRLGNTQEYTYA